MEYKVSVIIPVYNVEPYLSRCLESVLNQTYKNLEIILINDGSTDSSGVICDEFALKDKRIKVIHKMNEGLSTARNTGIDISDGEYITFIDSDDFIHFSYVQKLISCCLEYGAEIAQCSFEIGANSFFSKSGLRDEIKIREKSDIFDTRETKILAWGKIYKKEIFSILRFPKNKSYEDEFTTYKALYTSNRIVLLNENLYYYFQAPNSLYRKQNNFVSLDFIEAYEERIQYFIGENDFKLVEISKKELCIRCMIYYIKFNLNKDNQNNKQEIINLFKTYYHGAIRSKYTSNKEKTILTIFNKFPRIMIFIVDKLQIKL